MRISDIDAASINNGLRVRSLADPNKIGTIYRDSNESDYFWIIWDNEKEEERRSGFYNNDCSCEIVDR